MPAKREYGAATRRSARLASQTNSRASSVSQETNSVPAQKRKARPRTRAAVPVGGFDAAAAHRRIVEGDRAFINTLTEAEKGAVIQVLADREVGLLSRIEELEAEKAGIARERDDALRRVEEKRVLRDALFRERVAAAAAEQAAAAAAAQEEEGPEGQGEDEDEEEVEEEEVAEAPASALVEASTPGQAVVGATPPRTSLLRRVWSTFASPFARQSGAGAAPVAAGSDSEPLGELPASRKRPAPEPAPEITSPAPMLQAPQPPRALRAPHPETPGPHSRNPTWPTSLSTITEYTEPSSVAMDPTPSRPPVETPRRYRSIASVRSAQREKAAGTPGRSWSEPRRAREPNADRRLAKLRRFQDIQEELEVMKRDAELQEIVGHRVKRVKVDDLDQIPHKRPGDSAGTFRVPEIDSDDEMEVDDDVETRTNVFARAQAEQPKAAGPQISNTSSKKTSLEQPVTSPADAAPSRLSSDNATHPPLSSDIITHPPLSSGRTTHSHLSPDHTTQPQMSPILAHQSPPALELPSETEDEEVFEWPDIGTYTVYPEMTEEMKEKDGERFERGFKHWQETGEHLPHLWSDSEEE